MIAWGEILTSDQITQLVDYIRLFEPYDLAVAGIPLWRMVHFQGRRRAA